MNIERTEDSLRLIPKSVCEVLVTPSGIRIWHSQGSGQSISPDGLRIIAYGLKDLHTELLAAADFAEKINATI